jgi:hypothetical protein
MGIDELLIATIVILIFANVCLGGCKTENMTSAEQAVAVPNDWNQYIRDEAQRIVYLPNHVFRGGYCFPELVGWPAGKAAEYIKKVDPRLYTELNDERVPTRKDIYYTQPRRVILTIDSRGLVSRIPLSG